MEAVLTQPVQTDAEHHTANRSKLYSLLAEVFRYPDDHFRRQVRNGELKNALMALTSKLPYEFELDDADKTSLSAIDGTRDDDVEAEFIRLFEAGPGSPPCPLVEGLFREDRKAIFKELILFYNHFGLSYAEGSMEDRPDHICYEMEFLHFLTFKELLSIQTHADPLAYVRAQKDFLQRHLLSWVGKLEKKIDALNENLPNPDEACIDVFEFYRGMIRVAHRFMRHDYTYVENMIGQ